MILDRLRDLVGSDLTVRHFAWLTLIASAALSVLGVYVIDVSLALHQPETIGGLSPLAMRQTIFLAISVAAAALCIVPRYRLFRYVSWPFALLMLALLIFLLLPFVPQWLVTPRNGSRGWINLGVADFQPSEIAKIAFVIILADYLRYRKNHRTVRGLIPPALIAFVPVGLITLQPDLGTALLFVAALFAMLLAAGARLKHLTIVVIFAALAAPAVYPALKPHQKQRIIGMVRMVQGSEEGADDINYQSFTAVTLAGAGRTHGNSDEKSRALLHFNRLPERHNDMVFAVILNRFGLYGGLATLALYAMWFTGALLTAAICRDAFGRLVVIGCTAFIAAQVFVNVGMNLALLPITGLTLPFVSYGGSSILTVWLMTGIVFNVAMRRTRRPVKPAFEFEDDEGLP